MGSNLVKPSGTCFEVDHSVYTPTRRHTLPHIIVKPEEKCIRYQLKDAESYKEAYCLLFGQDENINTRRQLFLNIRDPENLENDDEGNEDQ